MNLPLHHLLRASAVRRGSVALTAVLLLAAMAFAPQAAQAQVVFDDFNDGDVSNVSAFSGGADNIGAGAGPTDGFDGTANAGLSVGVDPGAGGGFAGAAVIGAPTDASGAEYFTFYIRPTLNADNVPLVLEVNLQEDADGDGTYDGATEDEYQANYLLDLDGNATWQLVQLPLAAFTDDNSVNVGGDDGFDFSRVVNVVFAIGGIQGSGFNLSFDELVFRTEPVDMLGSFTTFDDFNDGDVSNVSAFSGGADNIGAGAGPTDGFDGTANAGLSVGVDPGAGGGFAGAAVIGAPTDASGAEYFTFYIRPTLNADNVPLVLEVNLQEDADGDGTYDGATEDEYQANYLLDLDGNATWQLVQLPLAAFTDDNSVNVGGDDGFDFSRVVNVVFAIGGIQGSGFNLSFDELAFATSTPVSIEDGSDLPSAFALTDAYPNPFNPQTRFELTLDRAQDVRVEVFDLLGRQVDVLHDGPLAAQTPYTFTIDAQGWSSGMYLYRVTGASFAETRSVVLVK